MMFKRHLVPDLIGICKQHHRIALILLLTIHRRFSKCIPPTADCPRYLRYLSTELSHLPRS